MFGVRAQGFRCLGFGFWDLGREHYGLGSQLEGVGPLTSETEAKRILGTLWWNVQQLLQCLVL